ncbi:MAG TPA: HD-GYP domain-containing protein [Gaiellales bacterium]|nr:HD-GYP domain-containing protein [Gaiellales bacterium]
MLPRLTGGDGAPTPGGAPRVDPAAHPVAGGAIAPALRDGAPCRLLGELLGLDAAWILAPGATGRVVTARWAREEAPAQRLGEIRLAAVVEEVDREAVQTHAGRYALLIAPLVAGGRVVAHLAGVARSPRDFRPDELRAAELVAAGAAAKVGPDEPPDAVSARARDRLLAEMSLLRSLTSRLAYARSEGEIAHAVVAELSHQHRFATPRFYLRSQAGDEIELLSRRAGDSEEERADAMDEAAVRAAVDGRARLVAGGEAMVAPMLGEDDVVGAVTVSGRGHSFDSLDLGVLEVVAAHAAVACRNVRLYMSMREAAEISEAMLELGQALATQVSVRAVAEMLARSVDRLVECAAMSVWLRTGERFELAAHVGYMPREADRIAASSLSGMDAPLAGNLESRQIVVLEGDEVDALAAATGVPRLGACYTLVPIGERAGNRAVMIVQRGRRRGPPSERDERMLLGIADQALLAIDNRALVDELEAAFVATMQSLANALETKDEYTGDHAQALVWMAEEVARRLDLGGVALRDVGVAAALHDVGKIGIPASILEKPGPLTDDEWEVMRTHPELGARIMEPVPALAGARSIVLACHEHWDGSGYPHGLAGDDIPLGARIILACDAFHAMTSDRVYRQAIPVEAAIDELRQCAGQHFEPRIVDVLVEVVGNGHPG